MAFLLVVSVCVCVCVWVKLCFEELIMKKWISSYSRISLSNAFFRGKPGGGRTSLYLQFPFHFFSSRGNGPFMSPLPTKLLMNWEDITTDHRDVPAFEMTTWWFNNVWFPFLVFVFVKLLFWSFSIACSIPLRRIFHHSLISKLFITGVNQLFLVLYLESLLTEYKFSGIIFHFAWNHMAYGKP